MVDLVPDTYSREALNGSTLMPEERPRLFRLGALLTEWEADAQAAHLAYTTGTPRGPITSLPSLDRELGGALAPGVHVLHAGPGVGKCLPGHVLVLDPITGQRHRLDEVVAAGERGDEVWVTSLSSDLRLQPSRVSAFVRNGIRAAFRLRTRMGREVEATANHPFLTVDGWVPLESLSPGTWIATPRALPYFGRLRLPDEEIALLGLMIGAGNATQSMPRFSFGQGSALLIEIQRVASTYGVSLGPVSKNSVRLTSSRYGQRSNPVIEALRRHGLWGCGAADKFVPEAIFRLEQTQVARFLAYLFGTDGSVDVSPQRRGVSYSTVSLHLAKDVQHLLLRFGIAAHLGERNILYAGKRRTAYELVILDRASLEIWIEQIGAIGKGEAVERLRAALTSIATNPNSDVIPKAVWERIEVAKGSRSWRSLTIATGRRLDTKNWHVGQRGFSRSRLAEVASWAADDYIMCLATSDLWWDEIISIEAVGEQQTYDITVEGNHTFVANDIVVHNTAFALQVAALSPFPALYLSAEMGALELFRRITARVTSTFLGRLRSGELEPQASVALARRAAAAAPLLTLADATQAWAPPEWIMQTTQLVQADASHLLVVVDSVHSWAEFEPNSAGEYDALNAGLAALRRIARTLTCPIVAIAERNRPSMKEGGLSASAGSRKFEYGGESVLSLSRDKETNGDAAGDVAVTLMIEKNRNGAPGKKIKLLFNGALQRFREA
jgi:replicative DNA helicase